MMDTQPRFSTYLSGYTKPGFTVVWECFYHRTLECWVLVNTTSGWIVECTEKTTPGEAREKCAALNRIYAFTNPDH